ncbi:MAG: class I SAM-dependent methyltransferase [Myxococcota bacterium]
MAWVREEARIDHTLAPFGRAALDCLALRPGQSVVDVGCGTGQTLLDLAAQVGRNGRVLGIDVSEVMVERARQRVAQSRRKNIEVALSDAEQHAFAPASWDAVFSRFGIMFFDDTRAACENLVSALREGGRLAFVCWQSLEKNPWALLPLTAVREALRIDSLPDFLTPCRPGPFRFEDPEPLSEALVLAGCRTVEVRALELRVQVGGAETLDQAVAYSMQVGPGARLLADSEPPQREAAAVAVRRALAPLCSERGVWGDAAAWLISASR